VELVIEIHLSVLHWHKHFQLLFENEESLVGPGLFGHEAINVRGEGFDITFSPVFVNRDSDTIYSQLILSAGLCDQTKLLLDVARGSTENLHFCTCCQVSEFTAFL